MEKEKCETACVATVKPCGCVLQPGKNKFCDKHLPTKTEGK